MLHLILILTLQLSMPTKSPQKAVLLSMAFPGGGQFYTCQYVKGAAVLIAEGTLIALTLNDFFDMREFDRKYRETGDTSYKLRSEERFDRILREGFILMGVWGFSMLDAFISAQLFGFEEMDKTILLGVRPRGVSAEISWRF